MRMSSRLVTVLPLMLLSCSLLHPVHSHSDKGDQSVSTKYKFLYFVSPVGASHYSSLAMSGKALAQQGHKVVSLVSSSNSAQMQRTQYADLFSIVVFNSSHTPQNRTDVFANLGRVFFKGVLNTFWGPVIAGLTGNLPEVVSMMDMFLRECDDLLGDSVTMKRLREEGFDMLVADDHFPCPPLLAQALDIPFIYSCVFHAVPSKHGYQ